MYCIEQLRGPNKVSIYLSIYQHIRRCCQFFAHTFDSVCHTLCSALVHYSITISIKHLPHSIVYFITLVQHGKICAHANSHLISDTFNLKSRRIKTNLWAGQHTCCLGQLIEQAILILGLSYASPFLASGKTQFDLFVMPA